MKAFFTAIVRKRVALFTVLLLVLLALAWWLLSSGRPKETPPEWQITVADDAVSDAQPALLAATLAALLPERPGVPDIYFVGFAADSREDVFMKEVEAIVELFRSRFDAAGRTVALVNNARTAGTLPNATATDLGRVLKHLGGIMNREQDVLVLYLTAHGSERHRLSVVNGPMSLQEIEPRMLARLLDDSGIRWRVVAVSACYAGGFIEPLKSATTLVMTAADAVSQSFGCGTESDFTYFGRALFDEELRETHSLTEAFGRASEAIAGRERAEKHKPSNPQMFVGAAMTGKLREIESRLRFLPPGGVLEEDR